MKRLIAILFILVSLSAGAQVLSGTRITQPATPVTAGTMTVDITFDTVPTSPTVTYTNQKYNKQAVFNFEWDDNSVASVMSIPLIMRRSFTDGCGNKVAYRAALGINGINSFNLLEMGFYSGLAQYCDMQRMIALGWDIENHSMYHLSRDSVTARADIVDLTQMLWNRIGYTMTAFIVPTNYNYYVSNCLSLGTYITATTQGAKDNIAIYPTFINWVDLNAIPNNNFTQLNRQFTDDWSNTWLDGTNVTNINSLLSNATASVNPLVRLGTHARDSNLYKPLEAMLSYLEAKAQDRVWVCSMRECFEYRYVKKKAVKTQALNGKTLRVTFDISALPNYIRWRDLSFKVTTGNGAKIARVEAAGVDRMTYNPVTGLVNIFKENLVFQSPALNTPMP